ncbi:hypothetical protein [Neptuniibacter sp.]|uniref:TapB family protein n=1 Tax=Neptuniibacter sp. TaxID=1962643 RepID=UPI003B5BF783
MRYLMVLMVACLLTACGSDNQGTHYFPLDEGMSWEYKVTKSLGSEQQIKRYSVTNMGAVKLADEYAGESVYLRKNSDGTDYYILQDDTGSHRIAKRTIVEHRPRFDAEERKILPGSKDLEVGRFWTVETQPYTLRSVEFHSLPNPGLKRFMMSNEITAIDVTVTVPAGTFENCIEVTGQGEISMYVDPRLGYQDILMTQKEWYAPGVGLVKLVREEPLDLPMFKGGAISFELLNFED